MTAVEFLEKELFEKFAWRLSDVILFNELIAKAKEMEKEQIKDAYIRGCEDGYYHESLEPEQYYNETFKSE